MLYYGDKYRKMKVPEIFFFFFILRRQKSWIKNKKIVEIEFYFSFFRPPTLDFR